MKKNDFRIWDPEIQFCEGLVKRFKYWTFEVSYRQHTLGSFLIILNRKAERISELTPEELRSLGRVMRIAELALERVFKPDRFNYLQLGNGVKHLHFHGIPRYEKERIFGGRVYVDENFGRPPVWSFVNVSHEVVGQIREAITKNLNK